MMLNQLLQWETQYDATCVRVQLKGELTRSTLPLLWGQRKTLITPRSGQRIDWELHDLERLDSAGFAFLCELLNNYQQYNPIRVVNPPTTFCTLADLFGLSDWIDSFLFSHNTM